MSYSVTCREGNVRSEIERERERERERGITLSHTHILINPLQQPIHLKKIWQIAAKVQWCYHPTVYSKGMPMNFLERERERENDRVREQGERERERERDIWYAKAYALLFDFLLRVI